MRIILTGGGTGGHIYPALAIARYVRERDADAQILYIGTARGLESDLVPRAGIPYGFIEVEGLKRKFSLGALRTFWLAFTGTIAARRLLRQFRPDLVVGTGGFVVAPVVAAAYSLGIRSAILEMDVHAGLANRLVSRLADTVMVAMDAGAASFSRARRVVVTGNPRASEVVQVTAADVAATATEFGLRPGRAVLTIVSGSRGASPINAAAVEWLDRVKELPFDVVFITGQIHFEGLHERQKASTGALARVHLRPYYHDLPALLSLTTLLVSRAGGTTLAEITALGVPSILIPSPYVTNRHQDLNAAAMVEAGAAVLLHESELTGETLGALSVKLMTNSIRMESMQVASRRLGKPDALSRIWREIESLLG